VDYVDILYSADSGDDAYKASCGLMTDVLCAARVAGAVAIYQLALVALEYIKSNPDIVYQYMRF